MKYSKNSLDALFAPNAVAVVGISHNPQKIGSIVFSNIKRSGFGGRVYGVNPKYTTLYGQRIYSSLTNLPQKVDLVVICVARGMVEGVVDECVATGVRAVVIISAGFGEMGGEGREIENRIADKLISANIRLLGPNCLGFICTESGLNASFADGMPSRGDIALVSQSGAICTSLLDMALDRGFGFSHIVSIGNKVDINEIELIEYFAGLDEIKAIAIYIEKIDDGQKLVEVATKCQKPIIILKPGKTERAASAIASHTGSMTNPDMYVETAFEQFGIIRAHDIETFFGLCMYMSWGKPLLGSRIGVITNAGGPGIMATDEIIGSGLEMATLDGETVEQLRQNLPPTASLKNPIDVIGDALANRYELPLNLLVEDEGVDAILVILTPQIVTQIEETARIITNYQQLSQKPIIPIFLGGRNVRHALAKFFANQVAAYSDIHEAVNVLSHIHMYSNRRPAKTLIKSKQNNLGVLAQTHGSAMSDDLAFELLRDYNMPVAKYLMTDNIESAREFLGSVRCVVLKIPVSTLPHKTEYKAIKLNISNSELLERAWGELQGVLDRLGVHNRSLVVQEQIEFRHELLVGALRDGDADVYDADVPGFGHLLSFGQGGIYAEVYGDIQRVLVPADPKWIESKLNQTKVAKILNGARGVEFSVFPQVVDFVVALQKLLVEHPNIKSIDINPLLVTKTEVCATDVKIFVE